MQSPAPPVTKDAVVANPRTRLVVGGPAAVADQRGVALWHELGCDGGADRRGAKVLADRVTHVGQQASWRCPSRDRAGTHRTADLTAQMDELGNYTEACCPSSRLRKSRSKTRPFASIEPQMCAIRTSGWRLKRHGRSLPQGTRPSSEDELLARYCFAINAITPGVPPA
jgi:hypothetical protein